QLPGFADGSPRVRAGDRVRERRARARQVAAAGRCCPAGRPVLYHLELYVHTEQWHVADQEAARRYGHGYQGSHLLWLSAEALSWSVGCAALAPRMKGGDASRRCGIPKTVADLLAKLNDSGRRSDGAGAGRKRNSPVIHRSSPDDPTKPTGGLIPHVFIL